MGIEWFIDIFPPLNLWNYPSFNMINEHDIKDYKDAGFMQPQASQANEKQYGGNHYKQFKGLEPWDVITYWGLGYLDGTALKYIARWKHKNGVEDLKKAIHFLEKAVEVYERTDTKRT